MNQEMEVYVAQAVYYAERTFGASLGREHLEAYAREAVLELWLSGPVVTSYTAELVLNQLHAAIARRPHAFTEQLRFAA